MRWVRPDFNSTGIIHILGVVFTPKYKGYKSFCSLYASHNDLQQLFAAEQKVNTFPAHSAASCGNSQADLPQTCIEYHHQ